MPTNTAATHQNNEAAQMKAIISIRWELIRKPLPSAGPAYEKTLRIFGLPVFSWWAEIQ
jgi:hypothetical protein